MGGPANISGVKSGILPPPRPTGPSPLCSIAPHSPPPKGGPYPPCRARMSGPHPPNAGCDPPGGPILAAYAAAADAAFKEEESFSWHVLQAPDWRSTKHLGWRYTKEQLAKVAPTSEWKLVAA